MMEVWYGLEVRVVSMPSQKLFMKRTVHQRRRLLPLGQLIVSLEAAAGWGWAALAHFSVSVDDFGVSGSGKVF
ncbi:hypothetical protein MHBO_004489 [Bonamia ostreae]|uniref:Transketolase-like C-terminal domain-containing protein n=1 Tax=Bonamia ostreae TaxID=126728 RepID=A0ABV2AU84_9EUKA